MKYEYDKRALHVINVSLQSHS